MTWHARDRAGQGGRAGGPDNADPASDARKARDAAMALPLVGVVVMLPPVAQIFAIDGRILGIPVPFVYIFGVWAALIAGARVAGRRVLETEAPRERPSQGQIDAGARRREGARPRDMRGG